MTKTIPEQIGKSSSFDFETNEWTFKMPEGFITSAGKFKIIPVKECTGSTCTIDLTKLANTDSV